VTVSILSWALFGALCGWITSLVVSSASSEQTRTYIGIGILGGIVGGVIGTSIIPGVGPDDLGGSSMMAVAAAVGLLWARVFLQGSTTKSRNDTRISGVSHLQTSRSQQSDEDDRARQQ